MSSAPVRPLPSLPPRVPIGPSVQDWKAMSEPERQRFYQQIFDARAEQAEAQMERAEAQAERERDQAKQAAEQAERERDQHLRDAREAVLDLAEAYGIEITAERRQEVQQAELKTLRILREALKTTRAWP